MFHLVRIHCTLYCQTILCLFIQHLVEFQEHDDTCEQQRCLWFYLYGDLITERKPCLFYEKLISEVQFMQKTHI